MATKYNRETDVPTHIEARRTPWMRQGPPRQAMTRRQRIFFIVLGLLVLGVLSQIALRLNQGAAYVFQPVVRGVATIEALTPIDIPERGGYLTLAISARNRTLMAEWPVPEPYWSAFEVGDQVAVAYQLSKSADSVKLYECGLVALPEGNQ